MQKIEFIKRGTLHGSTPSQNSMRLKWKEKNSHIRYRKCIIYVCMVAIWRLLDMLRSVPFVPFVSFPFPACIPHDYLLYIMQSAPTYTFAMHRRM